MMVLNLVMPIKFRNSPHESNKKQKSCWIIGKVGSVEFRRHCLVNAEFVAFYFQSRAMRPAKGGSFEPQILISPWYFKAE